MDLPSWHGDGVVMQPIVREYRERDPVTQQLEKH